MSGKAKGEPSSVSDFFERRLPAIVVTRIDDFFAYHGTIAFDVAGDPWTFEFGNMDICRPGFEESADLKLHFTEQGFQGFVDGTLDPVDAITGGHIKGEGDFDLLQSFGVLLMPLQRDLGWEAG